MNPRLLFLIVLLASTSLPADDWPQWLGPERDATWREAGIIESFPAGGLHVRWRRDIGGGFAGPAVSKGHVYVVDRVAESLEKHKPEGKTNPWTRVVLPGKERVQCLRESDGKLVWKYEYDCPYTNAYEYANGPRATPTVDGDRVYTLGAEGDLICFATKDGAVLWRKNFPKDFGIKTPVWGWASSPLVDGPRLLCVVGGQGSTAVAFDKLTGKEIWRSLSSKEPGYAAPVIHEIAGKRQLLIWHGESINGLDPVTGKAYWTLEAKPTYGMACSTPAVSGDHIYLMAYQHFSMLVEAGADRARTVWKGSARRGIPGAMNTPFIVDGHIFGDGASGRYTCADLASGEWKWTSYLPSTGKRPVRWATVHTVRIASKASDRGRYILANDQGELILAKLSPSGYEETSRTKLFEPSLKVWGRPVAWAHPAFASRSVYHRNDREIVCASLAAE